MKVTEAILLRKSIRGYKPDPVPKKVLEEILKTASHSPSSNNTQPWEVSVISGKALDEVRRGNAEMIASGAKPAPDVLHKPFEGIYRQRQVELAVQIFGLMGITREDKDKRAQWLERGFRFFGAPVAIIVTMDTLVAQPQAMLDLGTFCQSICLAALECGLGTCIEDQGAMFPEVLRKVIGIPNSKQIVISIAIGYPESGFPANKLQSKREAVENFATWYGFD